MTSPQGREQQIVTRFFMNKFIENETYKEGISLETRKFVQKVLKCIDVGDINTSEDIKLIKVKDTPLTDCEKVILMKAGYDGFNNVLSFDKIKIAGIYYCSKTNKDLKYCNSIVYCKGYGYGEIIRIVSFQFDNLTIRGIFLNCYKILRNSFGINFIKQVNANKRVIFVKLTNKFVPAIKISNTNATFVFKLANCWETN